MTTHEAKKHVATVLAQLGRTNRIIAKMTNFDCERLRCNYVNVRILDWEPHADADAIRQQCKGLGILLTFCGNFVQA